MTKYDYSYCSEPQDDETLYQAIQRMKKERIRWTPAKKAAYRNKLIQNWNSQQNNPLLHFRRPWMVRDIYQTEPGVTIQK
jgi:hypothetical protein